MSNTADTAPGRVCTGYLYSDRLSRFDHLWELTRAEFVDYSRPQGGWKSHTEFLAAHKDHEYRVRQALKDGLPVPPIVLADYPELVNRKGA